MKKLIMMSMFALGTITSFAGNGEKEIASKEFRSATSEAVQFDDSNEMFTVRHQYAIIIWRSFWDPVSGNGSSYGQTGVPQTPCFTEAEAETFRIGIENVYQGMNTEPNTNVWAVKQIIGDPCL